MGSVGDVVCELSKALAGLGCRPQILTPSYGCLHEAKGRKRRAEFEVRFRHDSHTVTAWSVPGATDGVRHIVLDHAGFAPGEPGRIYVGDDDGGAPYAADADKFAFFCAAAAVFLNGRKRRPDVVHLHDWHTGMLAVLREFDPRLDGLLEVPFVFTIHNLAHQGQRPMVGDTSSLAAWYPWIRVDTERVSEPRALEVFNPMAAAIRLCDRVNALSPSYADEIQNPTDSEAGFIGGEGLETVLREAGDAGRLSGILNGCDYSDPGKVKLGWQAFVLLTKTTIEGFEASTPHPAHRLALRRLEALPKRRPLHVLTSVGRIVHQKVRLFFEPTLSGSTALEDILANLGGNGLLVLVGTGDTNYEQELLDIARENENLIYVAGNSASLAEAVFAAGDLHLKPSSFAPSELGQLEAMRFGQPCVAHAVGALRDTIDDGVNGFVFEGKTPGDQAESFVRRVAQVLAARHDDPLYWHSLRDAARSVRFDWPASARRYVKELYDIGTD